MSDSLRRSKDRVSVLIIASDNMTGELLKSAFARGRKDFTVKTLTGSSSKVIGELGPHKSDIALICAELEDGSEAGTKVLRELCRSRQKTSSIMLLQYRKPECVVSAFRDGARGIFYRTHSLKALSKCIRTVYQGQIWVGNEDLEHLLNALSNVRTLHLTDAHGIPLLTPREDGVVRLVADGLKNREISIRLGVTEHSVRNYLYRIFEKLGVSTRVELILYALTKKDPNSTPQSR